MVIEQQITDSSLCTAACPREIGALELAFRVEF
jgi:hypothetical protein